MAEPRSRLVSTCSPAMGEFVQTFADATGVTMSELIRQALAAYMEYELGPADADPAKPQQRRTTTKAAKNPDAPSKRQLAINKAMEDARTNEDRRKEVLRQRMAQGLPI